MLSCLMFLQSNTEIPYGLAEHCLAASWFCRALLRLLMVLQSIAEQFHGLAEEYKVSYGLAEHCGDH